MENKPKVYTLCGSSRFADAFHLVNAHLSMKGHIVISLGLFGHADQPQGAKFLTSDGNEQTIEKQNLDTLHFHKIDISDAIFVINVGGYIGSSTKREIAYAFQQGKGVEYLFTVNLSLKVGDYIKCENGHIGGPLFKQPNGQFTLGQQFITWNKDGTTNSLSAKKGYTVIEIVPKPMEERCTLELDDAERSALGSLAE